MTRRQKPPVVGIVLLAIAVTIAVSFCVIFLNNDRQFSRDVWVSSADIEHDNPRLHMAVDVRDRVIRPGMSRSDVVRLLGKPDSGMKDVEYFMPGIHEMMEYYLGYSGHQFAIDPDFLTVYLDKSGHVATVEFGET